MSQSGNPHLELSNEEMETNIAFQSEAIQSDVPSDHNIIQHVQSVESQNDPYPDGTLLCIGDETYQVVNGNAGLSVLLLSENGQEFQQVGPSVDVAKSDNSIPSTDLIQVTNNISDDHVDATCTYQLQLTNRSLGPSATSNEKYLNILSHGGVYTGAVLSKNALGQIEVPNAEIKQETHEGVEESASLMSHHEGPIGELHLGSPPISICLENDTDFVPVPSVKHKLKKTKVPKKLIHCELCSATFNRPSNYHRHKLVHAIDVKAEFHYRCEECNQQFLQRCDLKRHLQIHAGTQPYACTICDKKYVRQSDLRTHMRFHNNDRAFPCPHCDKAFCQKGDLNRHVKRVHLKSKMATCGHCHKRYASEATLIRHMQTTHRELLLDTLPSNSMPATDDPVIGIPAVALENGDQLHVVIEMNQDAEEET